MSTKITYNGKTTELASGDIAILPCKDFTMATDVVVEAPEPAEVPTVEEWDGTGVIIEGLVKLISFTINGTSYQAEEGMTWDEWVESEYNTSNFVINSDNRIGYYPGLGDFKAVSTDGSSSGVVTANTEITADNTYQWYVFDGGGSN
jgi:hypothetical protein